MLLEMILSHESLMTAFAPEPKILRMTSFVFAQVRPTSERTSTCLASVRLCTGMCNDVRFQFVGPIKLFHAACIQQRTRITFPTKYKKSKCVIPTQSALPSHSSTAYRCSTHLFRGLQLAMSLHPMSWKVNHTSFIISCYFHSFYTGTELHWLVTGTEVWTICTRSLCSSTWESNPRSLDRHPRSLDRQSNTLVLPPCHSVFTTGSS